MKIDLNSIIHAIGDTQTVEFEEVFGEDFDEDVCFLEPVKVKATLTNSGIGIMVTGEIQARAKLVCGICLKPFEIAWTIPFEERFVEFQPLKDDGLKEEQEIKGEDIYFTYKEYEIDLDEMLRELLILNLPTAPKCDINCSIKINDEQKTIDPRLRVLSRLKDGG